MSWSMVQRVICGYQPSGVLICEIYNLGNNRCEKGRLGMSIKSTVDQNEAVTAGLVIRTTPNEVQLEPFSGETQKAVINCPHPWLLRIDVKRTNTINNYIVV